LLRRCACHGDDASKDFELVGRMQDVAHMRIEMIEESG
jgi:hypothetical protein